MNTGIEYRVYTIADDGKLASAKNIWCSGDKDAIRQAQQMVDGHAVELRCGIQFLGRFEPENR